MVVDKPNGMICVRDESLEDWPIIAHRLDKETSGALLMAKNVKALRFLMKQFKSRKIDKEYVSLVHGWIEPRNGRIRLPLANKGAGDIRQGVRYDGKVADTAWETIKRYTLNGEKLSLLSIKIYTGRTHQIRVHLAHLGYPVFSDEKYLSKLQVKKDRRMLKRHFLHAKKITFNLLNGCKKEVEIDLPTELEELIKKLE